MNKSVRKAVIPAAGFGTRFLPATKSMPKEMIPIIDKPAIHYAVAEAVKAGAEQIILITGRGKGAIEDYFDHSYELEHTLELKGKTGIYNLGSQQGYSVREIVAAAKRITGVDFPVVESGRRAGDIVVSIASSEKAEKELGWKSKYTLDDILRSSWAWKQKGL